MMAELEPQMFCDVVSMTFFIHFFSQLNWGEGDVMLCADYTHEDKLYPKIESKVQRIELNYLTFN